jgi:hypothetical protein
MTGFLPPHTVTLHGKVQSSKGTRWLPTTGWLVDQQQNGLLQRIEKGFRQTSQSLLKKGLNIKMQNNSKHNQGQRLDMIM